VLLFPCHHPNDTVRTGQTRNGRVREAEIAHKEENVGPSFLNHVT
jgi:hypothetical protein